jgi:hypothetical protein
LLLFRFAAPTSPEEGEILVEVADIAKEAADEAAKIAAKEATNSAVEEAREVAGDIRESSGDTSAPIQTSTEMVVVAADKPDSVAQPAAPTAQALTDALILATPQQGSEAPSLSGTRELNFDEEIARILASIPKSTLESNKATDSTADLAFLETMAAGLRDVQEYYGK